MYYNRIDLSEAIDPAKSNNSDIIGETIGYSDTIGFLIMGLIKMLTMFCLNISDIDFVTVKGVDYPFTIHDISKFEAIRLLENVVLHGRGHI